MIEINFTLRVQEDYDCTIIIRNSSYTFYLVICPFFTCGFYPLPKMATGAPAIMPAFQRKRKVESNALTH